MLNSVGLQGPGVDGVDRARPPRARSASARASSRRSGAAPSTTSPRAAEMLDRVADRASRSRSTCPARTSTTGRRCSPTRPDATRGGDRRGRATRGATALPVFAKLSPNVTDLVDDRAAPRSTPARRAHAGQHAARARDRRRDPPAASLGGGWRRAVRARRSSPSRCARCTTSRARCPDVPIIGTGGVAIGDRRGRDAARGRDARSASAPRRSASHARRSRRSTSSSTGARAHDVARVARPHRRHWRNA